jgi:hypothetical protein
MLSSIVEYSFLVCSIPDTYEFVTHSTLTLWEIDDQRAILKGEVFFAGNIRLRVLEAVNLRKGMIEEYGYEIYRETEKLYWYDSWSHPDDPTLASTHPHHKHIPPNIKRHRVPAPELSFTRPNLPFLIREIGRLLAAET